jgi:hypothetical protein
MDYATSYRLASDERVAMLAGWQHRAGLECASALTLWGIGRQCRIGQFDTRRVVLHRARCEQRPRCTVDVERVVAYETCVATEDTLLARPVDLAPLVGDHELGALIDGEYRRSDFDFDRHRR